MAPSMLVSGRCDQYCNDMDTYHDYYLGLENKPLVVDLSQWTPQKQAKREYRRAQDAGCTVERVTWVAPINDQLVDIWKSQEGRLDRAKFRLYFGVDGKVYRFGNVWPIEMYGKQQCPAHSTEMYVVKLHGRVVAYMETVKTNGLVVVHSTYGHVEYLKQGVMKFLFIEVMNRYKNDVFADRFTYGFADFLDDNRRHFVKDLGII